MKFTSPQKIIFIVADTLRAKNVGVYGKSPSPTPYIDKLAKEGVLFKNAYASITKTDPSITSMMTGGYPLSNGIINQGRNILPKEEANTKHLTFLSEILQKHGYKTFAIDWFSRWHKRGYDYYSGKIIKDFHAIDVALDRHSRFLIYLRILDKVSIKLIRRDIFSRSYYAFFKDAKPHYDPADVVVDKAIELIKKNKNKKLFLYLHFWEAHMPLIRSKGIKNFLLDSIEDSYNREVSFMDNELGRFFEFLEKENAYQDSLIIFTSDHGENFHEHDVPVNHEGLYEDVVKVPLFFVYPSFLTPEAVDAFVQHVDIFPTVLSLAGIPIPKNIDGKNLMPLIKGKVKKVRDFLYFEDVIKRRLRFLKNIRRRGIREGNYKYIQTLFSRFYSMPDLFLPPDDTEIIKEELYDLEKDPEETKNIFYQNKTLAKKMREKLSIFAVQLNNSRLQFHPEFRKKIEKSLRVIKNAGKKVNARNIAVAWTGGKDSTVLLHLVKKAFGKIPFKVVFNDSTMEFDEVYDFISVIKKLWNIELLTVKHTQKELKKFYKSQDKAVRREFSRTMKITAINNALKKYNLKGFMAGIRWDEHESRSKETYFSKRKDHIRIHPILHFTEEDIWSYIEFFGVPFVSLYKKGYRSLGEKPFTKVSPPGGNERSGREPDKEQLMARLRKLGYW